MPRCVPVLGYRSRSEAVRVLSAKGLGDREIAPLIGLRSAREVVSYRREAADLKRPRQVTLPSELMVELELEAEDRGLESGKALAIRLLQIVVEDDLIDAVLDDAMVDDALRHGCADA